MAQPVLVGRSSSHFTRVARLFALELDVAHDFRPVLDLSRLDAEAYAGNPALKVPILIDDDGPLFGTENICRELVRRSARTADVVGRGEIAQRVVANSEEAIVAAMSAEVSLITTRSAGLASPPKLLRSIEHCLDYLEQHVEEALASLPAARAFSFLEVTLFCLLRHLPFRQIMDVEAWPRLVAFADGFGQRRSATATEYRFDASPIINDSSRAG